MALRRALVLLSLVLAYPALANAQLRTIPDEAKRGHMRHVQDTVVSVDGNRMQIAPGAAIRDQNNMIMVPAALPRRGAWAAYLQNASGQISRVWLLSPAERAKPVKQSQ